MADPEWKLLRSATAHPTEISSIPRRSLCSKGEWIVERPVSWTIEAASNAPGTELLRVKSTLAEPDAALVAAFSLADADQQCQPLAQRARRLNCHY
jgi:hypothetical protein